MSGGRYRVVSPTQAFVQRSQIRRLRRWDADLERHLADVILAQRSKFQLVSAERRVIVSNDTTYAVGDLIPEGDETVLQTSAGWLVLAPADG
jgi:hypothetical protein